MSSFEQPEEEADDGFVDEDDEEDDGEGGEDGIGRS